MFIKLLFRKYINRLFCSAACACPVNTPVAKTVPASVVAINPFSSSMTSICLIRLQFNQYSGHVMSFCSNLFIFYFLSIFSHFIKVFIMCFFIAFMSINLTNYFLPLFVSLICINALLILSFQDGLMSLLAEIVSFGILSLW